MFEFPWNRQKQREGFTLIEILLSVAVLSSLFVVLVVPRTFAAFDVEIKLTASDAAIFDMFGVSVAISGDTAIVGAFGAGSNAGSNSGSAYVFERSGTAWIQQAKLTASDAAAEDQFGVSVAISGDTVIVGADGDDDGGGSSGSAYVFERVGATWVQQAKLTASDAAAVDAFGSSVAISGDTVIVGAPGDDDAGFQSGSAYIFERNGTAWVQQAKLTASDASTSDGFGRSVSISGDTAIAGAPFDDGFTGSAYVFERNGTVWVQQAKLTASDGATFDFFGRSVGISGDVAIVGARGDDDAGSSSGSAYIFERSGTTWAQQDKITASDAAALDRFGWSVAISGDTAIAGAPFDDGVTGSAYVFERNGTIWAQQAKITASDAAAGDRFGFSVAINGVTAIVGAEGDDDAGSRSGSAYVFSSEAEIADIAMLSALHTNTKTVEFVYETTGSPGSFEVGLFRSEDAEFNVSEDDLIAQQTITPTGGQGTAVFSLADPLMPIDQTGAFILVVSDPEGDIEEAEEGNNVASFRLDTDGDGLPDLWETEGIDVNEDGNVDLDLPALGALPNRRDLFVEVDAMVDRAPAESTLDAVVTAFADAPDGGIALHLDFVEKNIPRVDWPLEFASEDTNKNGVLDTGEDSNGSNFLDGFDDIKAARFGNPAQRADSNSSNILAAKALAYRYAIFGNAYGGGTSSGLAERPGDDFMVTLGAWTNGFDGVPGTSDDIPGGGGTSDQQAGSFMHEFGHTLGLLHGGDDNFNCKPNYRSVMNYVWQVPNLAYVGGWLLNYSSGMLPALDETSLDENVGIGGDPFVLLPVGPPESLLVFEGGSIDWSRSDDDNDGIADNDSNVKTDVNDLSDRFSKCTGLGTQLHDHNDWPKLRYVLGGNPNFEDGVHTTVPTDEDLTLEDFEAASQISRVQLDIKPGSDANPINLKAKGVLPVAILTTDDFDAVTVDTSDLSLIRFGDQNLSEPARVSPLRSSLEDVDGDGDTDLVVHFSIPEIRDAGALVVGSTLAELRAFITRPMFGAVVWGVDSVRIVPSN